MAGAAVIAGFGGSLISHSYLEAQLPTLDRAGLAAFERSVVRWWHRAHRTLGPASSTRAILDVAVTPLLQLLGHDRPSAVPCDAGISARLAAANSVLLVIPWSASPAAAWRESVKASIFADASWGIVANGRTLRIVDASRSWTRSAIEFDFEPLVATPAGLHALWLIARAETMAGEAPTLRSIVAASDAHAMSVCQSLGDGVLAALPALTSALATQPRSKRHRDLAFDQALTLVYRILFLLFAEARALVPVWNDLYRGAYTVDALIRSRRTTGLWQAFQAISRLAHAGCKAGDLDVTAFNGRLFAPRHAPLVEQRRVPDSVMRDVLASLGSQRTASGRRRISYHDLGVEQLGSVYERVLEHEPVAEGGDVVLARTSTLRKSTGSFYTPQALTELVVRRTLAPLVDGKTADEILSLRIVDPAMGSGAFLVAACMFLADSCEQARIRDGEWSAADVTMADRASLRRQVAERCLYGVDLNPTAVQLARVSLWLTTLAARRPLTFLDHHLAAGNSLIGARIGDLSRPPLRRPGKPIDLPLFADQIADDVSVNVMPIRLKLCEPSESLDIVKDKERAMASLTSRGGPIARWQAAADAWCAAALWPEPAPSAAIVREWIAAATGARVTLPLPQLNASLRKARELAAEHSAFHWELAFPEVFFDADGQSSSRAGFDAVIGNPPWDVLGAGAAVLRYHRLSGTHHSTGHPNSYQLFVDRALQLTRAGGRIGLILPSGIATDHGSAPLRRRLLDRTTIDTWIGFDNRRRIFPIHRSMRFVVLTITNSGSTETLRFRCGLTELAQLNDGAAPLTISRARIASLSPEHVAIPDVPSATALGILTSIADRVPALGDDAGWHARFGRELNATDDRHRFVPIGSSSALLPIVEGKQLTPFQVDLSRSTHGLDARPSKPRLAYRDVASATNKLTLIAAMLPAHAISTHTVFCLKTDLDEEAQWCLLGLLNSFVANYLVRLNVTTHVTASLMSRLPVPRPRGDSNHFRELAHLSRALAATGAVDDSTEYARLNAIAARLYGVSREEYAFILETFPLIAAATRDRCLSAYSSDIKHRITEPQN